MHEPRLAEIVKVLVYQPEHPAEEHEGDQLSECVYHGGNYSINRLLEEPVGEGNMLAEKRDTRRVGNDEAPGNGKMHINKIAL